MGTLTYMSPEQVRGEDLDARTDLFSFGVVLYEMATGRHPFEGETSGVIADAILNQEPVAPVRLNPKLSPKLEEIISKAMEKNRKLRYQNAADIRTDLQRLKRDTESGRASARVGSGTWETEKLAGFRWGAIVGVTALVGLALGGWFFFVRKAPPLTNKDTIVLADFANTTEDAVFDGALRQGLSVQLEQSPFLSIVPEQQVAQTLQMMGRNADAKLTKEVASEVCERTGSAAFLEGTIAQIGAEYQLTLRAANCVSGETLASAEAHTSDKNHVLDALGQTASEIRSKLGESLSTVQKFDTSLEQATTPSLEGLKAFSSGIRVHNTSGDLPAVPFFKRAIELDPKFAIAYAWLGLVLGNLGEYTAAIDYTRRAYELRERASVPEQYFITGRYHRVVTGNMEKAEQSCQLWMQAYPRMAMPHIFLAGSIYPVVGQYEKGAEDGREAVRLSPDFSPAHALLLFNLVSLNRVDEVKSAYQRAMERKLKNPFFHIALYQTAFLQRDAAGMSQQVTESVGGPGIEHTLLANEAETAAYSGRLREAREFSKRAMDSAESAKEQEASATYAAVAGLREALFGNRDEARRLVTEASKRSSGGRDIKYAEALALAYVGDNAQAQALADELSKDYPEATIVLLNYLPTLRAKLAGKENGAAAVDILRAATPDELGQTTSSTFGWTAMYPVFVRGEAYLNLRQGSEAAGEFQKILDHPGVVLNGPIGALSRLGLGRAYALQGDTAKARAAYKDFLAVWKDADAEIPILAEAKSEYGRLK